MSLVVEWGQKIKAIVDIPVALIGLFFVFLQAYEARGRAKEMANSFRALFTPTRIVYALQLLVCLCVDFLWKDRYDVLFLFAILYFGLLAAEFELRKGSLRFSIYVFQAGMMAMLFSTIISARMVNWHVAKAHKRTDCSQTKNVNGFKEEPSSNQSASNASRTDAESKLEALKKALSEILKEY